MEPITLAQAAAWCGGVLKGGEGRTVTRVCTDSRAVKTGDLFVAIKGPNFDGHNFALKAAEADAAAVLVSRRVDNLPPEAKTAVITVADTLFALGELARNYREQFKIPVVGITGSSGKTTTKEFLAAILRRKFRTVANAGNLNNLIGLPLSVMELSRETECAVFEMGMSEPGEIARLAEIAQPTMGIITMIGACHIETMGSVEAIINAKAELIDYLKTVDAPLVLDSDHEHYEGLRSRATDDVIVSGSMGEIHAIKIELLGLEGARFTLQGRKGRIHLPGRHNIANALLAVAAARRMGIEIKDCLAGIADLRPSRHRLTPQDVRGVIVIDDSYNANPMSFSAALELVRQTAVGPESKKVLVIGDMLELGPQSPEFHRAVGCQAVRAGVSVVIAFGEQAAYTAQEAENHGVTTIAAQDHTAVLDAMMQILKRGDLVLIKGSHGMALDRVVEDYKEKNKEMN